MKLINVSILLLILSFSSHINARYNIADDSPNSPDLPDVPEGPSPSPANSDCSTIIYNMADCLSYISIGSNDTEPEKSCCEGIESVLEYNPECVCVGLESSKGMGIQLNTTRAVAMPSVCNISIAPPHCNIAMAPTASMTPSLSPVSPSSETPDMSPSSETPEMSPSSSTSPSTSPSPAMSPANSPTSAESPANSPSSAESPANSPANSPSSPELSPANSPSSEESPDTTASSPTGSGAENISVSKVTIFAVIVSSIAYISVFLN